MSRIALAVLALLAAQSGAAGDGAVRIEMREAGYMLGDLLEQRIVIELAPGEHVNAESLPPSGRLNHWLEVRRASLNEAQGRATVDLSLQIFAAVEQATPLRMPDVTLAVSGPGGAREHIASGGRVVLSPVLPPQLAESDRAPHKAPAPAPLQEKAYWLAAALACLTSLAAATWLAWLHDRLPFLGRNPGPFTRLLRELRRRAHADETTLRHEIHAALNQCAGATLYPTTLQSLFERAPHLEAIRTEIEQFFHHSWNLFYTGNPANAMPVQDLMALLRRARECERGTR
ncbi:MAG TPA: hypothetical protein PLX20_11600 [Rhodocyclaceae bacterium]|nr:hypothetical protein [Rhodocyclaceae bacterium]HMV55172.1 hypothetical protein [Rhodocyclaceae bacterium]HNB78696.1 hypothetical protein [Rhodocyclaceae bacterium]HNH13775.1 hypothetical protein [Rhodocyclaceae bacterium]HNH98692.1 hypothetical protein [Rhodocyclaceae bacterium]